MTEALNAWPYVSIAYGLCIAGTLGLTLSSWFAMKRAEARRDNLRGQERMRGE